MPGRDATGRAASQRRAPPAGAADVVSSALALRGCQKGAQTWAGADDGGGHCYDGPTLVDGRRGFGAAGWNTQGRGRVAIRRTRRPFVIGGTGWEGVRQRRRRRRQRRQRRAGAQAAALPRTRGQRPAAGPGLLGGRRRGRAACGAGRGARARCWRGRSRRDWGRPCRGALTRRGATWAWSCCWRCCWRCRCGRGAGAAAAGSRSPSSARRWQRRRRAQRR
jgi:hypothetical protein